jgi:hypothetical protein
MSDGAQTPGDVVAAAKAASRRARLLPVFTVPKARTRDELQYVAEQLRRQIENGDLLVLADGITLQFLDREPGSTVTFEIRVAGEQP